MKKTLIIEILLIVIPLLSSAQNHIDKTKYVAENHFSILLNLGMATQIHSYPDIYNYFSQPNHSWHYGDNYGPPSEEEFGKNAEDLLFSFGIGFNYNYHLNHWISLKPQACYIQKGSSYRAIGAVGGITSGNFHHIYNNRFHYLSFDFYVKFNIKEWEKLVIYFQTGVRNDILLHHTLEYDVDMFSGNDAHLWLDKGRRLEHTAYPDNSGYIDFNNYSIGLVNSFGVEFSKGLNLGFEFNPDLSYLVKNEQLKVRNCLFSLNISYKIQK